MTREARFFARSASDRTDDWPFWFVADREHGGQNVTADLYRRHVSPAHPGGVFLPRDRAEELASIANCYPPSDDPTPSAAPDPAPAPDTFEAPDLDALERAFQALRAGAFAVASDLHNRLMDLGLTERQAASVTAHILLDVAYTSAAAGAIVEGVEPRPERFIQSARDAIARCDIAAIRAAFAAETKGEGAANG